MRVGPGHVTGSCDQWSTPDSNIGYGILHAFFWAISSYTVDQQNGLRRPYVAEVRSVVIICDRPHEGVVYLSTKLRGLVACRASSRKR